VLVDAAGIPAVFEVGEGARAGQDEIGRRGGGPAATEAARRPPPDRAQPDSGDALGPADDDAVLDAEATPTDPRPTGGGVEAAVEEEFRVEELLDLDVGHRAAEHAMGSRA